MPLILQRDITFCDRTVTVRTSLILLSTCGSSERDTHRNSASSSALYTALAVVIELHPTETHTSMTSSYTCFEELEASVPMSQLRPSVAFSRCTAHLPHDVDQLHGDELVQSMEIALVVHSKARVVLQCWVLLIMRRRVDTRHEKDALYDLLQHTAMNPQEKIRYRRGAMLLWHLLVERDAAEADSLLDRYLVDFYFPW